jgi:hypothetical protein
LLWKLKPPYKRNLKEDLIKSFEHWDLSVEDLAWYFAVSARSRRKVIDKLNSIINDSPEIASKYIHIIEGYVYWLGDPKYFFRRINSKWKVIYYQKENKLYSLDDYFDCKQIYMTIKVYAFSNKY